MPEVLFSYEAVTSRMAQSMKLASGQLLKKSPAPTRGRFCVVAK